MPCLEDAIARVDDGDVGAVQLIRAGRSHINQAGTIPASMHPRWSEH